MKQALFERIEALRAPRAIVSSNTCGIPISALADGRSADVPAAPARHALLQPAALSAAGRDHPDAGHRPGRRRAHQRTSSIYRLGKGVVVAKDTPNFIANHIGLFGVVQLLRALESGDYTIEEIDAITGPAIGRPKSATFRTMDIAGLDVLGHVLRNLAERLPEETSRSRVHAAGHRRRSSIERGWIGEKAGQGFYKRAGLGHPDARSVDA